MSLECVSCGLGITDSAEAKLEEMTVGSADVTRRRDVAAHEILLEYRRES